MVAAAGVHHELRLERRHRYDRGGLVADPNSRVDSPRWSGRGEGYDEHIAELAAEDFRGVRAFRPWTLVAHGRGVDAPHQSPHDLCAIDDECRSRSNLGWRSLSEPGPTHGSEQDRRVDAGSPDPDLSAQEFGEGGAGREVGPRPNPALRHSRRDKCDEAGWEEPPGADGAVDEERHHSEQPGGRVDGLRQSSPSGRGCCELGTESLVAAREVRRGASDLSATNGDVLRELNRVEAVAGSTPTVRSESSPTLGERAKGDGTPGEHAEERDLADIH